MINMHKVLMNIKHNLINMTQHQPIRFIQLLPVSLDIAVAKYHEISIVNNSSVLSRFET